MPGKVGQLQFESRRPREDELARFCERHRHQNGQGLVEYALILMLVAAALVIGLQLLSGGLNSAFSYAVNKIP